MSVTELERIKACVLGHAVGDALGVPVEFEPREALDADPVTDMRGYGSFPVPPGAWSDDTSMSLCALEALGQEHFSWEAVMDNFVGWLCRDEFTPTGVTFDVGGTCAAAIERRYLHELPAEACGGSDEHSNGNGSLMRIIPFVLRNGRDLPFIERASALTHAHPRSRMACGIYALILTELLEKRDAGAYKNALLTAQAHYGNDPEWQHFAPLADIGSRVRDSIRSSGYVVDTLEAALWCLVTTKSYAECVLKAVNLGSDTDTVAAVAGGLAGAVYGLSAIPAKWLDTLLRRDYIETLCERAAARWAKE